MFTGCKEGKSLRPLPDGPNQHGLERAFWHQASPSPHGAWVNSPPVAQGASKRGCSGPPADTLGVYPWSPGTVFSGLFSGEECGLSCSPGLQVETWVAPTPSPVVRTSWSCLHSLLALLTSPHPKAEGPCIRDNASPLPPQTSFWPAPTPLPGLPGLSDDSSEISLVVFPLVLLLTDPNVPLGPPSLGFHFLIVFIPRTFPPL